MLAGAAALLLASAAPSGIQLATPADSGAVSLAVIVVPPGGNFLQHLSLPPAAGESEGDLVSLVEHRRTFVGRVLAGPHVPGRVVIRQIYPEMASFRIAAVRRLAVLERTAGGYWYVQWQIEIRRGRACLDAQAVARYRIVIPRRAPDRNGEICFRL